MAVLTSRLEDQAFDRAHRLGQQLDVNIYKLTIPETVEDRILAVSPLYSAVANASSRTRSASSPMPRCRARASRT